jgi:hypothetical protein
MCGLRVDGSFLKQIAEYARRTYECEGESYEVSYIRNQRRQSGDWRSQVDARSTHGQAPAADGGGKPPHSTWSEATRSHEADSERVAKHVCRARFIVPLQRAAKWIVTD